MSARRRGEPGSGGGEGGGAGTSAPGARGSGERRAGSGRSELALRWIVAAVGIPAVAALAYLGGWFLAGFLALVAALSVRELYVLAGESGAGPLQWLGIPAAALLVLAAGATGDYAGLASGGLAIVLTLTLLSLAASVWVRGPGGRPLVSVAVTVVGAVYLGATLAFGVLLRELPAAITGAQGIAGAQEGAPGLWSSAADPIAGGLLLAFPLVVTWLGDSAAYFGGKRWGKRKLLPRVSPKKTVFGGVAGLVASTAGAGLYAWLFLATGPVAIGVAAALPIGLLLGGAGQVGDLIASVLKREAGAKDSGRLLPGHGGVLDRVDSLLLTLPLAYVLLLLAGGSP